MNQREIFEEFKRAYEFEHERKDALNSRFGLVLTPLVLIIGAAVYFINNIRWTPVSSIKIVFFILLTVLLIILGFAFYYLLRCLILYKYRYIARPHLIEKYVDELEEYNKSSDKKVDIEEKLEDYFRSQYVGAASMNRGNNKIKNGYFIRALIAVFLGSICVVASAVPFYALKANETNDIVYVNVKNFSEIAKMMIIDEEKSFFEKPVNGDSDPEPVEPTPPPPEDINEADVNDSGIEKKADQGE